MQKITLQAQSRAIIGRQVKTLRNQGLVPGVVYGHGFDPLTLQVSAKDFEKAYKLAGQSTLVYLDLDGKDYPTIIQDVTLDPVSDKFVHADFYKVKLDEKITAHVPVVFVGESPAVKDLSGILVKNINEIEVEAFPQDLPHEIEVDISALKNFHDSISVGDLKLGEKVEIKANPADAIVLIQEPRTEEELKAELETPTATAEDVEVIKKEKPEGEEDEEAEVAEKAPTEKPKK